jgi:hypothetical protein
MSIRPQPTGVSRASANQQHMTVPFCKAPDFPEQSAPFIPVKPVMPEDDP